MLLPSASAQDNRVRIRPIPVLTSRCSSIGNSLPGTTISSPTSTPLANSTAHPALLGVEDDLRTISGREPAGISALDPQLVCYSWMTGIDEVAQIVFVRKRLVEVQYLRATITEEQRQGIGLDLVEDTVRRIESAQFLPHSGIRFPQNPGCSYSAPTLGSVPDKPDLVEAALRFGVPGVDGVLVWLDELVY